MSNAFHDPKSRMDRRRSLQWMLSAAGTMAARDVLADPTAPQADAAKAQTGDKVGVIIAKGYGPDPSMVTIHKPGGLWPLNLSAAQRRCTTALCDIIVPAEGSAPSASALGVPDFLDEWISAPYPDQAKDRELILEGLRVVDEAAQQRHRQAFADLSLAQQVALAQSLADASKAKAIHPKAFSFFRRLRDLCFGAWCTTPEGMKAIGYVGNAPSGTFAGPPPEALRHVGLI